ncbi:MAG: fibronectin type III domain-containing protein [Deltaproteobacteria bacterium]
MDHGKSGFTYRLLIVLVSLLVLLPASNCWGLSYPSISVIRDSSDDKDISTISIAGGETIIIGGSGFVSNAKVYFAPVLKRYSTSSTAQSVSNVVYTPSVGASAKTWTIESGTPASSVTVVDNTRIRVKTPGGKLFSEGVMVVNPDFAASDIYQDLAYDFAQPDAPLDVTAKRLHDSSGESDLAIKLSWDSVPDATGYEIYRVSNGNSYFLASTSLNTYMYTDILPNTEYRFKVKAVKGCGVSEVSDTSSLITTSYNIGTYESRYMPDVEAITVRTGDRASMDLNNITYYPQYLRVDLTKGTLKGCREVVIDIPVSIISSTNQHQIKIDGNGFQIKFNPAVFNSAQVRKYAPYKAGVRFRIAEVKSSSYGLNSEKGLSPVYQLEASLMYNNKTIPIKKMDGFIDFSIKYNTVKTGLKSPGAPGLYRYDPLGEEWIRVGSYVMNMGNEWSGMVDTTGYYKVISK